ncbi:MAG TPA: hypothetical protein VIL49_03875 [Capillimicrobium sp.]|jgi:hypothetical protein
MLTLSRPGLLVAAAAAALLAGCGGEEEPAAPPVATPVAGSSDEDGLSASDGTRVLALPAVRRPVVVEVPACDGGTETTTVTVAAAQAPRAVSVLPCAPEGTGGGSVLVGEPTEDAASATASAGRVEVGATARRVVVPACAGGDADQGTGTVAARREGGAMKAPACTIADLPADAAPAISLGSRVVRLEAGGGPRPLKVPPCKATTSGTVTEAALANEVELDAAAGERVAVVGPCPLYGDRAPSSSGAGILVLAPGGALPEVPDGTELGGTVTVSGASGKGGVTVPGCTVSDAGTTTSGTESITVAAGERAPACMVPNPDSQSAGGASGGSGGGGSEGGGSGGSAG